MTIYDTLGVRTVLNVAGPVTRLSGAPLHPEVAAAMAEAAQQCVRIEDLQEAAGRELAAATGAAAGLALGAAACIAGFDVAAMDRLPDTTGLRNEVVIQRSHLTAYTHALRLAGAQLVEVGYLGFPGQGITWPWQIEAAITERTAALAYSFGNAPGVVPLAEVVAIARRHGLPVIVDAAAALPPVENLRAVIATGADLVAFSGGKAIGGPQASGILVGQADLIASVALQHQDMDVYPETWTWRDRYLTTGVLPGPPHHGLGRPMKVGKEEIVGLVVALRRFRARDHAAERIEQERRLATILAAVDGLRGVRVEQMGERDAPRAYPTGVIRIDEGVVEKSVAAIINELIEGDPPVAVTQNFLHERAIGIVTALLKPGEEMIVAQRLRAVLG